MRFATSIVAVIVLAVCGVQTAAAQDESGFVSNAEFEAVLRRMESYERRLAQYENRDAAVASPTSFSSSGAGVMVGADLLFLKPYQSEGESPGFDMQTAPRVWAGWTCESGLGFQTRWFAYHNENPENEAIGRIEGLGLTVVDFEVTDQIEVGKWHGLVSGGIRYADYQEFGNTDDDRMDDSFGPVIGVQMARPVNGFFSLFASARGSIQFAPKGLDNGDPETELTFAIAETQLGGQCSVETAAGVWFIRGAFESQYWAGGVIGDGDTEALSLVGGSISLGVMR